MTRSIWILILVLLSPGFAWAQTTTTAGIGQVQGQEGDEPKGEPQKPVAPPAYAMDKRELQEFARHLEAYLRPGKKTRAQVLEKFRKFIGKKKGDQSVLEDVAGISAIARQLRQFNPKVGKRGKTVQIRIAPDAHGFPGGLGTVTYHLFLPTAYKVKEQWPLLFCLPDNKRYPKGDEYIKSRWLDLAPSLKDKFIIAVPIPQTKGEAWRREKSWARAMITLRHLTGTFEATKKNGGPAVDFSRVFVEGGDIAAQLVARYPEVFAGVVLNKATGRGGKNLSDSGLSKVPAYSIVEKGIRRQRQFADRLAAANVNCKLEEVEKGDEGFGNGSALSAWLDGVAGREGQPTSIEYRVFDDSFQRHHWVNVLEHDAAARSSFSATANRDENLIVVEPEGILRFELFLNDALVDLSKSFKVVVREGDREMLFFEGKVERNLTTLLDELVASNHPWRIYTYRFVVDVQQLRKDAAAREAAEKAKKEAEGGEEDGDEKGEGKKEDEGGDAKKPAKKGSGLKAPPSKDDKNKKSGD